MPDRIGHRLGLGTAQFGLDYGLTSGGAPVAASEVAAILECAHRANVTILDTAAAYGSSEEVLGVTLARLTESRRESFRINSKLPSLRVARTLAEKRDLAQMHFERTLSRLGRDRIDGLMLHDASDLEGDHGNAIAELMAQWQQQGRVRRIGVSVYDAQQIELMLRHDVLDQVQLPISVYDQRLLRSGHLDELARGNIEVHARSALLQGLVLMAPEDIPDRLAKARPHVAYYRRCLAEQGVTPLASAIGFIKALPQINHAVIGAHSAANLNECLAAFEQPANIDFSAFALEDLDIIDPRRWSPNRSAKA